MVHWRHTISGEVDVYGSVGPGRSIVSQANLSAAAAADDHDDDDDDDDDDACDALA